MRKAIYSGVIILSLFCTSFSILHNAAEPVLLSGNLFYKAGGTAHYTIKSGIYTTRSKSPQMPAEMPMESYYTTYFDDFGEKELTENTMKMDMGTQKMEMHNFTLTRNSVVYSWKQGESQGIKYTIGDLADAKNYEALSAEMRTKYNYKELGTETIMGKECKKISLDMPNSAGSAVVSTWQGINMRMEMNINGMPVTTEVTELQENALIPSEKFEIPADVTFSEMKPKKE